MRTYRHRYHGTEEWKIPMQEGKLQEKRRLTENQSVKPPKVKILFYSLTRINGVCKRASMNDQEQEES